jgi:hypothetical protein
MVPKPKALLGDWHGEVSIYELSKSHWVQKRISRAPLDFCSGVACGFIFEARSCAPLAFEVGLVCAYNSKMISFSMVELKNLQWYVDDLNQ